MPPQPVKAAVRSLPDPANDNLHELLPDSTGRDRQTSYRGRNSAPVTGMSTLSDRVASSRGRRSAFMRTLSRKKSKQLGDESGNDASGNPADKSGSRLTRTLSRRKSLCKKITRQKSQPTYGSRAKTGPISLKAKERVLLKYPELAMSYAVGGDKAHELVIHGANSIRAEIIDMNTMVVVMQDNMHMLTHETVERFFEWIPLFSLYLERYMLVEEDLIFRWVEGRGGSLKGKLSPAQRMMFRGRIQRELQDIVDTRDRFVRHVPAGQRLSVLSETVDTFTNDIVTFFRTVSEIVPPILRERCSKSEIVKSRGRIVRHVVEHVGYQDFLALYTRWMPAGDLLEWKTSVLLPCDFKFFSYATWEKDMDGAHYQIAAGFGEMLEEESRDDEEANRQSKMDFERARQTRLQLLQEGLHAEVAEEEEYEDSVDESSCEVNAATSAS